MRYYASTQQINTDILTSVDNPTNAADGDPTTFSTLNRLVGVGNLIDVTQFLKFTNPVTPGNLLAAGTKVTVKLSVPPGLLSLLGGVEIQPFKNLHDGGLLGGGWQADAVGSPISGATLLSLLSSVGDQEITIAPTGDFDGVWVRLAGVAVGQSVNLYDAYIMQPATTNVGCNTPVDVLSGVKPLTGLANIGSVLGTVQNPGNAIDTDPGSYAEIDAVANVLNSVYHTTVFNSPTHQGDIVKMIIQNSGAGLLDLNLGSGFSVQLYNGATAVGSPIIYNTTSLDLKLFPLASNKYELDISPQSTAVYDRVEVSVGGVATLGLTQGLRIYDVTRVIATPVINSSPTPTTATICQGGTTTLTVSNAQDCTTYKWYDAATGGNLLFTGSSYPLPSTLSTGTHTYYVEASRDGCTETTARVMTTVNVNPLPTVTPGTANTCAGKTATPLNYTNGTNTPTKYSIVWDTSATNFVNVTDAALPSSTAGTITLALPAGTAAGTYTGNLTVKNANQCSSNNIPISIQVNALPTPPVITITN
ncbi:hypothetical protein [Mucilaginibacter sp. dw_454]|uniref:immunoglobulin domain-containing protein n=1 Tax=Mucilaginibacter sp. dw_454 TaxID=2720079 RepID=UPI001BD42363|nr:hypothetical protein [Mucilaginibacter sp. dw_454]